MTFQLSWIVTALSLFFFSSSAWASPIDVNCSDSTADTLRLTRAIEHSHSGDLIQIHGVCRIDKTISLLGDRTYVGDSRTGTVLRQAEGANLPALLASDSWVDDVDYTGAPIRIAHLTLDGASTSNSGTNVLVIRSWLTVLDDLLIENAPADGLQITNLSRSQVGLKTSQVNGRISNIFVLDSGANGIHVVDTQNSVTDWNLVDSWVADSGKSAIYLGNAAGWTVRGNHLWGVQNHAIYAERCFSTSIEQNYIEDFGDAGNGTFYGIACTMNGGAASVIGNNRIFMLNGEPAQGKFIYVGAPVVNYGTGQLNVTGNTILGAGKAADIGMAFERNGGYGFNLLSSGNNVQGVHTDRVVGPGVKLVTPI